ncbi:hypothetical protein BDU57DRAFT_566226 [Ampelomyces quisqualis]|uniref:Uncharacterized protein n=1 Tax=Ampelomyces quisqualis TaxID=50730 RepID=A0A6A5Q9Q9_AMPQU|nr:hypothetical protein BDU57DRAFT_566226 [Ampelomyces quisqualis]
MAPAERLGHYLPTWKLTRKQRDDYNVKHVELIMRQPDRPWKMRPRKLKESGIRDLWHEQDQDIIRVGGRLAADYTSVPRQDGQNQRLITEREAKVKESGEKSRANKAALALLEKERDSKHSRTASIEALEDDSAESESEDSGQENDGDMGGKEGD